MTDNRTSVFSFILGAKRVYRRMELNEFVIACKDNKINRDVTEHYGGHGLLVYFVELNT